MVIINYTLFKDWEAKLDTKRISLIDLSIFKGDYILEHRLCDMSQYVTMESWPDLNSDLSAICLWFRKYGSFLSRLSALDKNFHFKCGRSITLFVSAPQSRSSLTVSSWPYTKTLFWTVSVPLTCEIHKVKHTYVCIITEPLAETARVSL